MSVKRPLPKFFMKGLAWRQPPNPPLQVVEQVFLVNAGLGLLKRRTRLWQVLIVSEAPTGARF